jgi:glycosyltransferase involved in cell wall biosynthesis
MKLIFLTNLYPPASNGGFEQWCQEVADGLRSKGHIVTVLTTDTGLERVAPEEPGWIHRRLHMEMEFGTRKHSLSFFTQRERYERENLACLEELVRVEQPDLLVVWGMWNLSRALPALAESLLPGRVVFYFADYWPSLPSQHEMYWQAPAQSWASRLPKTVLKPVARWILDRQELPDLTFERGIFPSRYLQEEYARRGVPLKDSTVIPGAVDTGLYGGAGERGEDLSLLYAGRISPEKGIETAIEALGELCQVHRLEGLHLTVVGGGERGYRAKINDMVRGMHLEQAITFHPPVPKEQMPELYRKFDVFLFPSTWQEPFGRVLVEAMASGLVVVGTTTGGAGEILSDGENALTFQPGDASGLARQILRLAQDISLRKRLIENGRRTAVEKYNISGMVQAIEEYLLGVRQATAVPAE